MPNLVTVEIGPIKITFPAEAASTGFAVGSQLNDRMSSISIPPGARGAGLILGENGGRDYHLVLHAGDGGALPHAEAKAYAAGRGLNLPNRREGRLLQANCPDVCNSTSIWLEDDYETDPAFAWYQYYYHGYQSCLHKSAEFLAVAVSRLFI